MKEFAERLINVERQVSEEKGPFLLFALFLREDAPNVWDLVVAAPWIEASKGEALRYLVARLKEVATATELEQLSRIVIVEKNQPALAAMQSAIHIEHGVFEIRSANFSGLQIKHAYVITSRREEPAEVVRHE